MNANPYRDFVAEQKNGTRPAVAPKKQDIPPAQAVAAECGSGWYHDVAIAESQQASARKH